MLHDVASLRNEQHSRRIGKKKEETKRSSPARGDEATTGRKREKMSTDTTTSPTGMSGKDSPPTRSTIQQQKVLNSQGRVHTERRLPDTTIRRKKTRSTSIRKTLGSRTSTT
jgi:hypothetical protein